MEEDQRCINTEYNISKRKEYRPMNPELDSGTKILPAGPRAYTMSSIHTYSSLLRRNDSNPLSRIHTVEKYSRRGCVWSCARDIYRNYSISFQTPCIVRLRERMRKGVSKDQRPAPVSIRLCPWRLAYRYCFLIFLPPPWS